MEYEYKILIGKHSNGRGKSIATLFSESLINLETQVNGYLFDSGECVGGVFIKDHVPYQAVTFPKTSTNSDPTNRFTTAVRSVAGGGGAGGGGAAGGGGVYRKTRKHRR
jgi:hypothetical protein